MKELVYKYYSTFVGIEPTKEEFEKTLAVANYLKDNNKNAQGIFLIFCAIEQQRKQNKEIVLNNEVIVEPNTKNYISFDELPNELWNVSLLEKNKFYYSEILHLKSKPPTWNPITFEETCEEFYLEMIINFTIDDLMNYYYEKCRIPLNLQDDKKVKGALMFLINKYDKFKAPGIDYVISLIEAASNDIDREMILEVFEIEEYAKEVIQKFDKMIKQAEYEGANKIVWRK